jgi:release factor glutamine methyltransferase
MMIYGPKEDSYLLEKEVKKLASGIKVLDMGSASGIIGKAALEVEANYVLCVDIQEDVINFLKKKRLNAIRSDLFENIHEKFDLICFNPPYLPKDLREDPESEIVTSGGVKGYELVVRFLSSVDNYLNEKGKVLIVISSLTPRKRILKVLEERGFEFVVVAKKEIFMEELEVLLITRGGRFKSV